MGYRCLLIIWIFRSHQGRWICKAPRGYDQVTTKSAQTITINDEGRKIKRAFEWKALNKISNVEIIRRLHLEGFDILETKLSELFKNPFYCGFLSHKYLNYELVPGNHPPIVSKEIFDLINNRNTAGYEVKKHDKHFHLTYKRINDYFWQ